MRSTAFLGLVVFLLATPLRAQDNARLAPMLQHVIDLPEMEQVFSELGIAEQLCLVQTPVLPPDVRLAKFGQELVVHATQESAYFRCGAAYVRFTEVTVFESSRVAVTAYVRGPEDRSVGGGVDLWLVLKEESHGWTLERFGHTK